MAKDLSLFGNVEKTAMPSFIQDSNDAGLGNENVSADSLSVPQIKLLQALSPEIQDNDNLKAGLFLDTVSNESFESFLCYNLMFDTEFAVFKDRSLGGGKIAGCATREEADAVVAEQPGKPSDFQIVETHIHNVIRCDEQGKPTSPARMYWKSSALSTSKNWNTQINTNGNGQARFALVFKVSAEKVKNDKGTFFKPKIEFVGWCPSEEVYAELKNTFLALSGAKQH